LRQSLKKLGYIEGNFVIEFRGAEASWIAPANVLTELVQLKVDVLIVPIFPAILAAKQATKTIPIVMVAGVDSVASGIVDSLARSGGNITGLNTLSRDLGGKRIQLLTEVVPRLSRLGVLRDGDSQNTEIGFKEYETAGQVLNRGVQPLEVRRLNPDVEAMIHSQWQNSTKANPYRWKNQGLNVGNDGRIGKATD
jgi:putative ABC transport system substrate-binding protein